MLCIEVTDYELSWFSFSTSCCLLLYYTYILFLGLIIIIIIIIIRVSFMLLKHKYLVLNSWCLAKRHFLWVSGVLTLDTFYDIVLYFEPVGHKFHISKCLSGSTLPSPILSVEFWDTLYTGCSPLHTSRTCRGDWFDNILNWNPCPETYRFLPTAIWKQALPERTSRVSTSNSSACRVTWWGVLRSDHVMSIDVYPTSRSWFEPHSCVFQC